MRLPRIFQGAADFIQLLKGPQMLIGSGRFIGTGGHRLHGTFTLTKLADHVLFETSEDFFFDGAPEPGWALSKGTPEDHISPKVSEFASRTRFGEMPGEIIPVRGKQLGRIPGRIWRENFDTVFLWCFSVPFILGVGPIERN